MSTPADSALSGIIAVVNQKGGTGKTTTALNLGAALAETGARILLIDLDPQAHLTYSLGIQPEEGRTLGDALSGEAEVTDCIVEAAGCDVLPSGPNLADVELALGNAENREGYLKELLEELQGQYHYIVIDCPPSMSLLSINAFAAAHQVLVPMQLEVLALNGLQGLRNTIEGIQRNINPGLIFSGVVPVMFDPRRKLSHELLEVLRNEKDLYVYNTHIRPNVKLAEAPSFGKSIFQYDSSSNGAADYRSLAQEFLSRQTSASKPKKRASKTLIPNK